MTSYQRGGAIARAFFKVFRHKFGKIKDGMRVAITSSAGCRYGIKLGFILRAGQFFRLTGNPTLMATGKVVRRLLRNGLASRR
jgi:hypothetical protein